MRPALALACLLAACSRSSPSPSKPASVEIQPIQAEPPAAQPVASSPREPAMDRKEIDKIIAELRDTDAAGIGFSPSVSGSQFLPLASTDQQGMLLLGQPPPQRSAALTRLVAAGASAVAALLDCLDDATATRVPPMKAMMWTSVSDEYDVNRRTTQQPANVNLRGAPEGPAEHAVSVGDLCFVALGQIVNRHFSAVRYQPTGGLIISSPPRSAALRSAARAEWAALTEPRLQASLSRDFTEPDHEARRVGAIQRLRYYFPAAAAPLLAAELARPIYDSDAVYAFVRTLYGLPSARRAHEFSAFVAAQGEAARDGILITLFGDLSSQEAYEEKRVSPPTAGADIRARQCLVELFGYQPAVRSTDRPYPKFSNRYDRERLLQASRP